VEYVAAGTVQVLAETGERSEVLATPAQTGDRYVLRLNLAGRAKGPERHVHPGLVESFLVRRGSVGFKLGREASTLGPGESRQVPSGAVHGLWSAGDEPAELDVEVIFTPPGPRPEADLVWLGEWYGRLSRHGRPSLLQMAVLLEEYSEAFALPLPAGLQLAVVRPLAALGHLRGHRYARHT
jgi:quercetin dioxygenase-like cupin family protein